ncbi:hypothetical protein NECAME_11204 [Necator americanus]|uniref:Uncharacterized protein n=1 Tax=Necator americanus TaxID=51031 RepID=W2T7T4_NECAM|nr:hypothetical protein NECAME_11204 [Necator americanus]ETN77226.1 hypothetical protein NECAME_11204 [Necator americanus]
MIIRRSEALEQFIPSIQITLVHRFLLEDIQRAYNFLGASEIIRQDQSLRQLRKRLFLIEKLRDASTVGLVVGSVGVRGHIEAVQRMRKLCKAAGKRLYVISVGKVNVPKLSNFADIDAFVLLSCPFGVILDSSDFFRPVLSMFEAEMALNSAKSWDGYHEWSADFTTFANGDYLKHRTWRGLDAEVRLDESTKVELGRTGTAMGYDTEPAGRGDSCN